MSEESNIELPVKRTRTVKPKPEPIPMATKEDVERLEACISKLAVMCGQGNLLREFNIDRWVPSKADTRRKFN